MSIGSNATISDSTWKALLPRGMCMSPLMPKPSPKEFLTIQYLSDDVYPQPIMMDAWFGSCWLSPSLTWARLMPSFWPNIPPS